MKTIKELLNTLPQQGKVEWIGIRPATKVPMISMDEVLATPENGLAGDRYKGAGGKRHVTLIQAEHLSVIASCAGVEKITPDMLRRNIVISGINLKALKDKTVWVGEAELEITDNCAPCSRMEDTLGPGGYNAMRGHGGLTARVIPEGLIRIGDAVAFHPST